LQDRLEQFRTKLEYKLSHLTPNNFRTSAIPPDATKQESPIIPDDQLLQIVASVYAILRTEVMQEVGQLSSFIKSEVQSLSSQCGMQSKKVEQNAKVVSRSEATNKWLLQHMAEIGKDVIDLRERDATSRSDMSKLRSQLEVVACKRDEHIKEQGRRADESAACLNSVKHVAEAYQQALALPAVMLEAAESLRGELWQVVDPLREDVTYLKRAHARSRLNDKKFGDLAESKDPKRRSSPHEVTRRHGRFSDLEVAHGAESRLVRHLVGLLQKEYAVVQDAMNNLEGQLKEVRQESWLEMAAIGSFHEFSEEMRAKQETLAEKPIAAREAAFRRALLPSGRLSGLST